MNSENPLNDVAIVLRERAEKLSMRKAIQIPENIESLSPQEIQQLLHELQVYQIELTMQNEELRRAQADLDASRARYFDLYDQAPVGYCTITTTSLILEANLTLAKLLGVTKNAMVKLPLSRFIFKDDQDIYYRHRKQLFETGLPQLCELRMLRTDRPPFWARLETITAQDGENEQPVGRIMISDITESKQTEQALRESNSLNETLLRTIPFPMDIVDAEGRVLFMSDLMKKAVGRQANGERCWTLYKDNQQQCIGCPIKQPIQEGKTVSVESFGMLGGKVYEIYQTSMIYLGKIAFMEVFLDITARKRAEEERRILQDQLLQSQKMESVGRLAGGVAHDFNNMLGVIIGHAELALMRMDADQPLYADLQNIRKAAERSAALTRQLLAFARKQIVLPKVLDLNEIVEGMYQMLRRLIGEDINLVWLPGTDLSPIMIDPSQIDQLLANLCVNSRDSISGVGKVIIQTTNTSIDAKYCATHAGFVPGDYVSLIVSDDGCGMEKETVANIFEPFYTTKDIGHGTGLGLSTVYGIVKQNNGYINVNTAPGMGATFSIHFPRYIGNIEHMPNIGKEEFTLQGQETILLVEDEPAILKMTTLLLEHMGYTVLAASTLGETIRLAEEHADGIHMLLTDVIMPAINGRDLANRILSLHPNMKCLFMSGYTAEIIARQGMLDPGVNFIQKPLSMKTLANKVREVLDA